MNSANLAAPVPHPSKALHVGLWVAQVLLFLAFMGAGGMKLVTPAEELLKLDPTQQIPLTRFIGVAEVLGALGMILPAASRIRPGLTPLAALGLFTIMVLASGVHVMKGDIAQAIPVVGSLGALAAFVAWGRWKKAPIAPRR
ncbi:DoxX family protein [Archangium sp.]|uniref:DoxX family protein n=1 Tax=Archangium sp. TaxID=1872627 RepID=UPI00286B6F85|nr:DoxX family protein [Archangium sp.]